MKYVKWAALILVVLAIVAAVVVQWRRDAIALDIANRVLRDTDFVVASIAVRTPWLTTTAMLIASIEWL